METAVARPEELKEFTKWMKEFEQKALAYDLEDPSIVELARTSTIRVGAFTMWKMMTKGSLA